MHDTGIYCILFHLLLELQSSNTRDGGGVEHTFKLHFLLDDKLSVKIKLTIGVGG